MRIAELNKWFDEHDPCFERPMTALDAGYEPEELWEIYLDVFVDEETAATHFEADFTYWEQTI